MSARVFALLALVAVAFAADVAVVKSRSPIRIDEAVTAESTSVSSSSYLNGFFYATWPGSGYCILTQVQQNNMFLAGYWSNWYDNGLANSLFFNATLANDWKTGFGMTAYYTQGLQCYAQSVVKVNTSNWNSFVDATTQTNSCRIPWGAIAFTRISTPFTCGSTTPISHTPSTTISLYNWATITGDNGCFVIRTLWNSTSSTYVATLPGISDGIFFNVQLDANSKSAIGTGNIPTSWGTLCAANVYLEPNPNMGGYLVTMQGTGGSCMNGQTALFAAQQIVDVGYYPISSGASCPSS